MWIPAGTMTVGNSSLNDPRVFPSGFQGNNPGIVERHDYDDDDSYYFWLFGFFVSPSFLPSFLHPSLPFCFVERTPNNCVLPCGKKGACISQFLVRSS